MALTYTPDPQLGKPCPEFNLSSVDGRMYSRGDFVGRPLVVAFICNHCPYVQAIEDRLIQTARQFKDRVHFVAICANDPAEYPEDAPQELARRWREKNYGFPYLIDETQEVAQAFQAVCTPDLYLFDSEQRLQYRGRLDDSWRNPALVRRQELKGAMEAVLKGQKVPFPQNPAMGCSIKWKKN